MLTLLVEQAMENALKPSSSVAASLNDLGPGSAAVVAARGDQESEALDKVGLCWTRSSARSPASPFHDRLQTQICLSASCRTVARVFSLTFVADVVRSMASCALTGHGERAYGQQRQPIVCR